MRKFSLVVHNVENQKRFEELTAAAEEMDLIHYVFDDGVYYEKDQEALFASWDEMNWSSSDGCMILWSEAYPDLLFELTVQDGDIFRKIYFKDGMTEVCVGEVVYESPRSWYVTKAIS